LIRQRNYPLMIAMLFGMGRLAIHPGHHNTRRLQNALALAAVALRAMFHRRLFSS
jgi:hypothetical protein